MGFSRRVSDLVRKSVLVVVCLVLCVASVSCTTQRPSFYDPNNIAEYYGRCPKCRHWVKGYWSIWDTADEAGKLVGGGSGVLGSCENCGADLIVHDAQAHENNSRIVHWKLQN